ncbi:hypothetical protein Pint_23239 [Pistacia integerrima]|uniref:Uncharacterized protein n=2 Tax=Pistacia integerrima TaxID=434235 RepID=A0ACC0YP68_9ROSI|nr:hypothetical protein Pint_23244 [Pistacia integerrima]KAJ0039226.1 hypothetical protein Pint_23239 [Pistacia integerrima]
MNFIILIELAYLFGGINVILFKERINIRNKIEEEEKEKLQKLQLEKEEMQLQKRKKRTIRGNSRLSFAEDIGSDSEEENDEYSEYILWNLQVGAKC